MSVPASLVKELREKTGAGMMECKQALEEAKGSMESAMETLRVKGVAKAGRKAGRTTSEGRVATYVHPGDRIGVMIEVNCETDFAARNDEFGQLVRDLCMHIAAASPEVVTREEMDAARLAKERELFTSQAREMGKPEKMLDKIVDGMMDKWFAEVCLLDQPFVKEPKHTVRDHLTAAIARIGENMQIRRFARFELGK
jgi:elongation factor Ts